MSDPTPFQVVERVASTQDVVHAWGEEGRPHGSALLALEQEAGRGSRGREWASPRGGLWMSVLCRPAEPEAAEVMSIRVGLQTARVLEELPGLPPVRLKWPNDMMLADRKLGGILCEARWRGDQPAWVAVGIGINVTNALPLEIGGRACRLADHTRPPSPESLGRRIVAALLPLERAGAILSDVELHAFERRDWLRGRRLIAPEPGLAAGVSPGGALRIRAEDGTVLEARAGSVALA
ncbi:MAG: biotin--[acetyl-CoA-carboxylase] ligase [Gemmatimonadales bacterium]